MNQQRGALVISLDFELHWGVCDIYSFDASWPRMLGAREVIPLMLDAFRQYDIHATWATVGMLFFNSKHSLLSRLPPILPRYTNSRLSSYTYLMDIGTDEETDPIHFAPSLIEQIRAYPGQEIGTHTFSHYYVLEGEVSEEAFCSDLSAAVSTAETAGLQLRSIVFPRNQIHEGFVTACEKFGIQVYRGNPPAWAYQSTGSEGTSTFKRATRLIDAYAPLFRHTYPWSDVPNKRPVNIRASRFLRPYSPRFSFLEPLRERRIMKEMTHAAMKGEIYHLWWHPHNFGTHVKQNMKMLHRILEHFSKLRIRYGMESLSMEEMAGRAVPVQET